MLTARANAFLIQIAQMEEISFCFMRTKEVEWGGQNKRRDGKIEDHSGGGDQIGRALEPFQSRAEGLEINGKADIRHHVVEAVWSAQ